MVTRYLRDYAQVLKRLDSRVVENMARVVLHAWKTHRTVFCCGNGGSAANACHFIADLTKLTAPSRGRRIRAMALTESMSAISAIANDISYDEIFVEQMRPFVAAGDVVFGFSTSGSSPNVIRAIEYANAVGAVTVGMTGRRGAVLQALARHTLVVDSESVQHIEDATMVVAHVVCLRVKELIASASSAEVTAEERSVLLPVVPGVAAASVAAGAGGGHAAGLGTAAS